MQCLGQWSISCLHLRGKQLGWHINRTYILRLYGISICRIIVNINPCQRMCVMITMCLMFLSAHIIGAKLRILDRIIITELMHILPTPISDHFIARHYFFLWKLRRVGFRILEGSLNEGITTSTRSILNLIFKPDTVEVTIIHTSRIIKNNFIACGKNFPTVFPRIAPHAILPVNKTLFHIVRNHFGIIVIRRINIRSNLDDITIRHGSRRSIHLHIVQIRERYHINNLP